MRRAALASGASLVWSCDGDARRLLCRHPFCSSTSLLSPPENDKQTTPSKNKNQQPAGAALSKVWGATLYHRDDLPFKDTVNLSDMPDVFTPFKDACERRSQVRMCWRAVCVPIRVCERFAPRAHVPSTPDAPLRFSSLPSSPPPLTQS